MHEECVRRTGAQRPLVVGDRLDTDIEGARRAGADSLLVLTGVTEPEALLAAAPVHRPDLLAQDAAGLLVPHPAVVADGPAFRCGSWSVRAAEADGVLVLCADGSAGNDSAKSSAGHDADGAEGSAGHDSDAAAGGDGLDGLRALCVAHWVRHPNDGAPARVLPDGDQAAAALRRWSLSTGE
jgi:hypothetical protein